MNRSLYIISDLSDHFTYGTLDFFKKAAKSGLCKVVAMVNEVKVLRVCIVFCSHMVHTMFVTEMDVMSW